MASTSTSSDPTAATTTTEGPVLSVITKRLRALRKKHNRILQMEESLSQGKTLNKEQEEVLRSKSSVLTLIDELEKLRSPLSFALQEELSSAISKKSETKQVNDDNKQELSDDNDDFVKELLQLMYFGSLFDVKQQSEFTSLMLTRTHERGCCLTYDYVTDDETDHLLVERDLDLISELQGLIVSRPTNSPISHQNALENCVHHAKLWLSNSNQFIDSQSDVTYAGLKEKLKKIMASDYFTATPHMKGPGEVAAAVGVQNFGSFQVPMPETMVSVEVPVQIEESVQQYPDTENAADCEGYDIGEHQSGSTEDFQKDDVEDKNPPELLSAQIEHDQSQAQQEQGQSQAQQEQEQEQEQEHGYRSSEMKEHQYTPRRGSRGGRGGGRRGYFNGRGGRGGGRGGGGPYQNGGRNGHQHYDNYYQPRNYYNKRGGRGGGGGGGSGGGGNFNYNHPSTAQGNHAQTNIRVES